MFDDNGTWNDMPNVIKPAPIEPEPLTKVYETGDGISIFTGPMGYDFVWEH
jgi:hypothetical protein